MKRALLAAIEDDAAPAAVLLLDAVAGAAAAFSIRRLSVAYAGKCCNIRRSSDNTPLDIGFTAAGDFDAAAFSAFIGVGSGFVTTWYDQSGNGRDATQATAAKQPQLLLATIGSRPALVFVRSSSQVLNTASFASGTSPQTFAAVAARTGSTGLFSGIMSAAGNNSLTFLNAANKVGVEGNAIVPTAGAAASDSAAHSLIGVLNGASSIMTVDGTDSTGDDGGDRTTAGVLYIGALATSSSLDGDIAEAISWGSLALSSGQRTTIRDSEKSYFGTP